MKEDNQDSLKDIAEFISEYASVLMGSGVHTSRIIRNTKRMAACLDVELKSSIFQKSIIFNVIDPRTKESYGTVTEFPSLPINFEYNAELSALSWEAVDNHLSLSEVKAKYEAILAKPRMNKWLLLLLVGVANGSFCRLFGGDWIATAVVFIATLVGFFVRTKLQGRGVNHYIVFIVSALVASVCASSILWFGGNMDIALTTSVLFLIPGVPLINGIIDIVEGYTLTGIARLTNAFLLIICIAIGLSFTLWVVRDSLL